jgi:hypothetical protein
MCSYVEVLKWVQDLHTATHTHIFIFIFTFTYSRTQGSIVLRIENITILPTIFTTSKINAFT